MDLSRRSNATEWMDTETVTDADYARCLADLATVNRVTLAHRPTLAFLAGATRGAPAGTVLRLLDVAFGQGDMLRAIHRWATRRGLVPELAGIDLNPVSAAAARAQTPPGMAIDYRTGDVFATMTDRPDFIVSSLFTHHLPDPLVERFVDWMEATARRGWMVNDLHRLAVPYHGFGALARLAGWHRFVRHDGPVSIARSFRPVDWHARLRGLPARVERWFPGRLCVMRDRDGGW